MPLYLPRPEPIDLSIHGDAFFMEAHVAREKWLAIIETGGFDKEAFDEYYCAWKKIEERAMNDPWEQSEENPFGFVWTDVSFHTRKVYVECAHFETLNLLAIRAVRLLASEADNIGDANELEMVAKEAFTILSKWKNLVNGLIERYACCARDFWATVIQIVSATRLLYAVKNESEFSLETFYQVRDAPLPTFAARHPALIELFIIRDERNGLARIEMLHKSIEILRKKSSTLAAAVSAAREKTALAKMVHRKIERSDQEDKKSSSWFWRQQRPNDEDVHPVVRECLELQKKIEHHASALHVTLDSSEFSWSRLAIIMEKCIKI